MTTAADLLRELEGLGVELGATGDRLKVNAPEGVVTPAHRERLRDLKVELLGILSNRTARAPAEAIIPLKAGAGPWPIFGVPGHTGDVFCYRGLASCLGGDRAFFGLQPPGLEGERGPMPRVEDVAAYFAEQVVDAHPRGPVVIAGYCAGGSVAFELARQLRARGQVVALLVMLGTPYPHAYRRLRYTFVKVREYLRGIRLDDRWLQRLTNPALMRRGLYALLTERLVTGVSDGLTAEQRARRQALQRATLVGAAGYTPTFIDVPLLQCVPGRPWRRLGVGHDKWPSLTNKYYEFLEPDQIAQTDMLQAPNVQLIAGAIEGCLAYLDNSQSR